MEITIRLNGSNVSVTPLAATLNGQGNQTLQWKAQDNSDEFDFDNPPITFDASDAPISGISGSGDTASATDNVSSSGDYTYHVHLIDSQGNHITWPPTAAAGANASERASTLRSGLVSSQGVMTTDPTIKNRPQ
jgi:hypothetical protein